AIAAGYLVAFRAFYMRIYVTFFFAIHQIVKIRTWIFFPLFLLAPEGAGAVGAETSNVAHTAHLAGFAVGALLTFVVQRIFPLHKSFVFPFEQQIYSEADAMKEP